MSLQRYQQKRDFKRTPEPKGEAAAKGKGTFRFVVQKHDATRLHYDFRLEMDGVLKSWAVPKGIPFRKGEKRLAVHVEDHPLSYIHFEGVIPQGQYGGGTVMVWDLGTYEPLSQTPRKDLAAGKLHFVLHGKKLQGEWYLVRLRDGDQWLLIRGKEDMRPVSAKADDTSALSRKTMTSLAKGDRVWQSSPRKNLVSKSVNAARLRSSSLKFIEPMKARAVSTFPVGGDWVYEIKFDGFRSLALLEQGNVRLISRNGKNFNGKFPEVVESLGELKINSAILDGEIVALDEEGRSSFQLLQAYELNQERPPILFYAFDLLSLDGKDLTKMPLTERKSKLEKLLRHAPDAVRYSASLSGKPKVLLERVGKLGLEGLIGKRADSHYESGRRGGAWIKLKLHREQEMVIGGYTDPSGTRPYFGALLVGFYRDGELRFAGKVGTGFNLKLLKSLHDRFKEIARRDCPFANLPEKRGSRYGQSITPSEMKKCHWLEPDLVAQVKFSEWTRDEKLRQPVFLGLREDKEPTEVLREEVA